MNPLSNNQFISACISALNVGRTILPLHNSLNHVADELKT